MKKFLAIMGVLCSLTIGMFTMTQVTGCKSLPDKEKVGFVAYSGGMAAGATVNLTVKDEDTKTNIVMVVLMVEGVTPEDGQTFEDAWTKKVQEVLAWCVEQGKLTKDQALIIEPAMHTAERGLDYIFILHPEWKETVGFTELIIKQFCLGFRTAIGINPNDPVQVAAVEAGMDKMMFKALNTKPAK